MELTCQADSDMSIVYFSLTIHNPRQKDSKKLNYRYWKDCEISTKGRICYRKHCHGPDDHQGRNVSGYHCQTEFEYQRKNKTRIMVPILTNLSETRTLQVFFYQPYVFIDYFFPQATN